MTKWKCDRANAMCFKPCYAEIECFEGMPRKCLFCDTRTPNWKRVPNLTESVFDLPDTPEWAQYAFVTNSGRAFFCEESPQVSPNGVTWAWRKYAKTCEVPGVWDETDWKNSIVKRPEKTTLPGWCKVGEWVWVKAEKSYERITWTKDRTFGTNMLIWNVEAIDKTVFQARLRPWTFEEAPAVLKVKDPHGFALAYLSPFGGKYIIAYHHPDEYEKMNLGEVTFTFSAFADIFTQVDGKPCGVLEHINDAGEWVE